MPTCPVSGKVGPHDGISWPTRKIPYNGLCCRIFNCVYFYYHEFVFAAKSFVWEIKYDNYSSKML